MDVCNCSVLFLCVYMRTGGSESNLLIQQRAEDSAVNDLTGTASHLLAIGEPIDEENMPSFSGSLDPLDIVKPCLL